FACVMMCLMIAGCSNTEGNHDEPKSNSNDAKHELHIAAAASLTDATKDLEKAFKKEHKDAHITFNYGGSGALRQQIEKGAPVDVFMAANTKDVDALEEKDQNKHQYAKAPLVLNGAEDTDYQSVKALKHDDKLAIGQLKSVPAVKYAEQ